MQWFSCELTVSCPSRCAWFPYQALTPSAFGPPSRCCIRLAAIFQTTLTLGICRDWDGSVDVAIVCASPIASSYRVFPSVPGPPTRRRLIPSRRSSMHLPLLPKQQSSLHGRVPRGCVYLSPYPTRCVLQLRAGRYPLERVTFKASCDSDARVMAYPLSCFSDPWRSSASSRGRVSSAPQRFPYRLIHCHVTVQWTFRVLGLSLCPTTVPKNDGGAVTSALSVPSGYCPLSPARALSLCRPHCVLSGCPLSLLKSSIDVAIG